MNQEFTEEEKALEDVVLTRLMRLNSTVYGLVFGILMGILLFVATIWLVLKGGAVVGPNLALLGQFFLGYQVTIAGAFIGFGYAFLLGFILGFLIASIYNKILDMRKTNRTDK